MKKIGFVIVNYNDSKNTINLINEIKDYNSINEIVIVDNKSTDDSGKLLKELKGKKIKLIENKENKGYAYALNVGSKYLIDKYKDILIVASNTDIKIKDEDILTTLANRINEEVVCVMPKVKEKEGFKYGWKLTNSKIDLLLNIPLINRPFRKKYINYAVEHFNKDISYVDVIYGCFFMIDGNILKSINYFDNETFLYYEEYILARKLEKENKKSLVDNTVYVEHHHNVTIGTNVSKMNKYKIYKKSQLYYEKEYNKANKIEMHLFKLFYYINLIPYKIKNIK